MIKARHPLPSMLCVFDHDNGRPQIIGQLAECSHRSGAMASCVGPTRCMARYLSQVIFRHHCGEEDDDNDDQDDVNAA
jgi:hypothetical protein